MADPHRSRPHRLHFVKLTKNPEGALSEDGFELVEVPQDERRWSFVHELDASFAGGKKIAIKSPLAGTTLVRFWSSHLALKRLTLCVE